MMEQQKINMEMQENGGKPLIESEKRNMTILPINRGKCQLIIHYTKETAPLNELENNEITLDKKITNLLSLSVTSNSNKKLPDSLSNECLTKLLKIENPFKTICCIEQNKENFEEFFGSNPSFQELLIIFSVFNRLYSSDCSLVSSIFLKTLKTDFIVHLGNTIEALDKDYLLDEVEETEGFIDSLVLYLEYTSKLIPKNLQEKFRNLVLIVANCLEIVLSLAKMDADLESFTHLRGRVKKIFDTISEVASDSSTIKSLKPYPVNFMKRSFPDKNIIIGSYKDVNHYVKTQFLLLKEDFDESLRNGINSYKENQLFSRKKEVDVYKNVRVSLGFSREENNYVIFFGDSSHFCGVNWETSNKFLTGSLVVISRDNFKQIYLGVVDNRRALERGRSRISVAFFVSPPPFKHNDDFVLLESTNFFEPYHQVMKALQNMPTTKNFPMYKYIISAETSVKLPAYLRRDTIYKIGGKSIRICDENDWPDSEKLKLNDSQKFALRIALTSEFAQIQGPPGTGKTYICLQIIEALLNNANCWQTSESNPILVVCYKNHSLDQVLACLIKRGTKVLRLGGQSSEENIKGKCDLVTVLKKRITGLRSLFREIKNLRLSLKSVQNKIISCYNKLTLIKECGGILHFSQIANILTPIISLKLKTNFLKWLFKEISPEINVEKIISLCRKHQAAIRDNKLSVVNKLPDPIDEISFEFLKICDSFSESPPKTREAVEMYSLSLYDLETTMKVLREAIHFKCNNLEITTDLIWGMENEMNKFNECLKMYKILKERQNIDIQKCKIINPKTASELDSLTFKEKIHLYTLWEHHLCLYLIKKLNSLQKERNQLEVLLEELNEMRKLKKIQKFGASVIGATTTGAARRQNLISLLKPKIVILEEAAEVLEAHAVSALSVHCQHVILIGDHKQLRPCPYSNRLAKEFHLNVSLFERMILNGLNTPTLTLQHRMRPEVAALISPSIYPELYNHSSVCKYPNVMGINKNVYFIDHNEREDKLTDSVSRRNAHEGKLILSLCAYLLQQGYKQEEITILSTYIAQKEYMVSARKNFFSEEVQITSVDNFQGRENRIILLSLVRCNAENQIGFLSIENRVCVALSRAKEGLFITGNMSSLIENSQLWRKINEVLTNNELISDRLPLKCKTHGKITWVSSAENLASVLQIGCGLICNLTMSCRHICTQFCHSLDLEHEKQYCCTEKCEKFCTNGHPCTAYCSAPCPPCDEIVDHGLECGHTIQIPCHLSTEPPKESKVQSVDDCIAAFGQLTILDDEDDEVEIKDVELPICQQPCGILLKCGHPCTRTCHIYDDPYHIKYSCEKPCQLSPSSCPDGHKCKKHCGEVCDPCTHPILKQLPCGHKIKVECYLKQFKLEKCNQTCGKKLTCGHKCRQRCGEICEKCDIQVVKKGKCGHNIKAPCSVPLTPSSCKEMCKRKLSCGHTCKLKCALACSSASCEERVCITSSACGHKVRVPCHVHNKIGELPWEDVFSCYCKELCNTVLGCGHLCRGTCGECVQGRLHKSCTSECSLTLICGHKCKAKCAEDNHLCHEQCKSCCLHGKRCKAECGIPCNKKCTIKCPRQCEHVKCQKNCTDPCPNKCLLRCPLKLSCGHHCLGFCGYKCPTYCFDCGKSPDSNTDSDIRFLYLEDCGHTITVNSNGQMVGASQEVGLDNCPFCLQPVIRSLFYKEKIHLQFQEIVNIKKQLTASYNPIEIKFIIKSKLKLWEKEVKLTDYTNIKLLVKFVITSLAPFLYNQRKKYHIKENLKISSLYFIIDYITCLLKRLKEIDVKYVPTLERKLLNSRINLIVAKLKERAYNLSEEQRLQFCLELIKLNDIIKVYKRFIEIKSDFNCAKKKIAYNDDIVDTIYAESKVDKVKCDMENMITMVNISEITEDICDLPKIFWRRSMHKGEWKICTIGHIYYSKYTDCDYCHANDGEQNSFLCPPQS